MTAITSRLRIAAIALGLLACSSAFAANKYYLQLTDIPGESAAKGHEKWIDVLSFSWGVTSASSGSGGAGVGKASFNDLSWTQAVDSSTPKFFIALATGKDIADAELDVAKTGGAGGSEQVFFKMQFEHTLATRLLIGGGSGGETLYDQAAVSSGEVVTLSYRAQKADGSFGDWVMGRFDIKNNSAQIVFSGNPDVLNGLFGSGGDIAFDAGAITAVPEPASAALLLGGLGGLGALMLRRRQLG